jgi:site-specific recombinase XerD
MTVVAATKAYLSKCASRAIKESTLAKYKTLTNQLVSFCARKGYIYIDQLRVVDMDDFYGEWKDGKKGKAKKLERLRSFVGFCVKRKLLAENIAEDLEAPPNATEINQKSPFEDEELERIYAACDMIGEPTQRGPGHRTWGGEDVRDFINVSIYTGLRISECRFTPDSAFQMLRCSIQRGDWRATMFSCVCTRLANHSTHGFQTGWSRGCVPGRRNTVL